MLRRRNKKNGCKNRLLSYFHEDPEGMKKKVWEDPIICSRKKEDLQNFLTTAEPMVNPIHKVAISDAAKSKIRQLAEKI